MQHDLFKIIKELEENFVGGHAILADGLEFKTAEAVKEIVFATNGRYMSGDYDEDGDPKAYYDILTKAVRIAARATDIDSKDYNVIAKNTPTGSVKAMLIGKELEHHLDIIENDRFDDLTLQRAARYGLVFVKRFYKEHEGKKYKAFEACNISNLMFHHSDIGAGPIVEKHPNYTAARLYAMRDIWDNKAIDEVIDYLGKQKDSNELTLYEVQGLMPKVLINETASEMEYCIQKHITVPDANICLYQEEMDNIDYFWWEWEVVDGRSLGRGIVEDGLEAQGSVNELKIAQSKLLQYAQLFLFISDDPEVSGNARDTWKNGEFINSSGNIRRLETTSPAINILEGIKESWENQFTDTTSTFASISGAQLPSNTPLGSVQIQNSEARDIFAYRQKSYAQFKRKLILQEIIPDIIKRVSRGHLLAGKYTLEQLEAIDASVASSRAWDDFKKAVISGKLITPQSITESYEGHLEKLRLQGDRRFIDIEPGYFKGIEYDIEIAITNQQINKQAQMQTLTGILDIASRPEIMSNPVLARVFGQVVDIAGASISSAELMQLSRYAQQGQQGQPGVPNQAVKNLVNAAEQNTATSQPGK